MQGGGEGCFFVGEFDLFFSGFVLRKMTVNEEEMTFSTSYLCLL